MAKSKAAAVTTARQNSPGPWEGAVMIPIEALELSSWNPNRMSDKQLAQLMEEIETDGFDEPLQVVRLADSNGDGARYRVIGGEHRLKACRALGYREVPCVVKPWESEVLQREKTVRRNLLRGHLDRERFEALVDDLTTQHQITLEDLPDRLGFETRAEFEQFYEIRQAQIDSAAQAVSVDSEKDSKSSDGAEAQEESSGGDSVSSPSEETREKGPFISYSLVFDDEEQREVWVAFVKLVKLRYPDAQTIGARIVQFLRDTLGAEVEASAPEME